MRAIRQRPRICLIRAHELNVLAPIVALCLLGCSQPERPNVLILLVDALRADRLGCYGYARSTSPHIDALAAEGLRFQSAYAQAPWTKPSIPTLFTSLYPVQHGVYEGEARGASGALESDVLADSFTTLAEVFRDAGYRTAGFVHNAHLAAELGFSQGFQIYEQGQMDAEEINQRFLQFVDAPNPGPFFAYLHYLDVHWPFLPEEPFKSDFGSVANPGPFASSSWSGLRAGINNGTVLLTDRDMVVMERLHDGGIAEIDEAIGRLLDELRTRGRLDDTIVLLTSDHGEELLDHGKVGHGGTLFREVIDVPLILRLPGGARSGVEREPARLLDVFPTLLHATGLEIPPGLEGRNLLSGMRGDPEIVAETKHGRTYRLSIRRGAWKLIRTYRTSSGVVSAGSAETFSLAPGHRVKVQGFFAPDGVFHAAKLTLKDSGDDDFEISGPIQSIDLAANSFGLEGYQLDASELLGKDGSALLPTLAVGEWVKAEGDWISKLEVEADKLRRLPANDRHVEVEGIIQEIEAMDAGGALARIGSSPVRLTEKTRMKGIQPASVESTARQAPVGEDPFSAKRVRLGEGLVVEDQLFDLASDPAELIDVAKRQSQRASELRSALQAWLDRISETSGEPAARLRLGEQSINELRELGYLE